MTSSSIKISIIVPVYNSEMFLYRCLRSILHQTFTDFELIIIDDGSTDSSGCICDDFAKKDLRIKVFHMRNKGVGAARNIGLDKAKGEWITFIDSDDYVGAHYLEHLIAYADDHNDLIVAYPKLISSSLIVEHSKYPDIQINSVNFYSVFTKYDLDIYTTCWSKLYKKSFLRKYGIKFPENMVLGEDHVFLYKCLLMTYNIYIIHYSDYYYCDTPNSLSKNFNSHEIEYLGYNQIQTLINEMIIQKHISDEVALYKLKSIIAYYIWRVLGALYVYHVMRNTRLSIIHSLDLSVVSFMNGNTLNAKILKFLLQHDLICLYDLIKSKSQQFKLIKNHLYRMK